MAQRRFFDFKIQDATVNLNDRDRRFREPGVYWGFRVIPGKAGVMEVEIIGESYDDLPPIDTEAPTLSILESKDFVTCIENYVDPTGLAERIFVPGAESGGETFPRIDLITAAYRYTKTNQPNPAVVYNFHIGAYSANPVPPYGSLSNQEIILAEIYVPPNTTAAAGGYGAAGVIIDNAPKVRVATDYNFPGDPLNGLMTPGVYAGFALLPGSTAPDVKVGPGTLITQDQIVIKTPTDSSDFTVADPLAGNVRLDAFYLLSRSKPRADQQTDYDLIKVQGTVVSVGGGVPASLPTYAQLNAAILALDNDGLYERPTGALSHNATFLGYVKVASGAQIESFHSVEKRSVPQELRVSDGITFESGSPFVGTPGMRQLFDLIFEATQLEENPVPRRVKVEGYFTCEDDIIVPSRVELVADKAWASIVAGAPTIGLKMGGRGFVYDTSNPIYTGIVSTTVGSYTRYQITIQSPYTVVPTLEDLQFAIGDMVSLTDNSSVSITGIFAGYVSPWVVLVDFLTGSAIDPLTNTHSIAFYKNGMGVDGVAVNGILDCSYSSETEIRSAAADTLVLGHNHDCLFGSLFIGTALTDIDDAYFYKGAGNVIELLSLECDGTFGKSNHRSTINQASIDSGFSLTLNGEQGWIGSIAGDVIFAAIAAENTVGVVYGDITGIAGSTDNVVLRNVGAAPVDAGSGNQFGAAALIKRGTDVFAGSGPVGGPYPSTVISFDDVGVTTYQVFVTPTTGVTATKPPAGAGTIGEIWIVGKSTSQFEVYNTGSSTGSFDWVLIVT